LPERPPNAPKVAKEDLSAAHSGAGLAKPPIEVAD